MIDMCYMRIAWLLIKLTTIGIFLSLVLVSNARHAWQPSAKTQQQLVSGRVADEWDQPIANVTVQVRGFTHSVLTDESGSFRLEVPVGGHLLEFSHIGYKMSQYKLDGSTFIYVVLTPNERSLEEVVVVGYGEVRRRDLTGSVASVKASDIEVAKIPSFLESIQGKMAGVQISGSSGEPGAAMNVSIRGASSLYGSSTPLFVIDGIPYDMNTAEVSTSSIGNPQALNPLAAINPSDIESIEVLKDASAAAIYGSRGANGVVLITTKRGQRGRAMISYDAYYGLSRATKRMDVLSADEYLEYQRIMQPNSSLFWVDTNGDGVFDSRDSARDVSRLPKHDWQREVLRTGSVHNHNLAVRGGSESTTYSASLGYLDQEAISLNNSYNKYNLGLRVDHKVNRKLNLGLNTMTMYSHLSGATNSGGGATIMNGVIQNIIIGRPIDFYDPINDTEFEFISPIKDLKNSYKVTGLFRNNFSTYLNYQILPELSFRINLGGMYSNSKGKEFYSNLTSWGAFDNGRAVIQGQQAYSISSTYQLSYNKQVVNGHTLNAMAAFEMYKYNFEHSLSEMANFKDESTGVNDISKGSVLKRMESNRNQTRRLSYFARVNYNIQDRHLFTFTYRIDGSDKFGPGNRFGQFPSLAYAWRMSEENFLRDSRPISDLKLRLSAGVIGNESIPSFRYMARVENAFYGGELGLAPASRSNPDLKWESTRQLNLGLDVGLFRDRVSFNADIYLKETSDMLLPLNVASRTGYFTEWRNFGSMTNKGIEFQLSTVNIEKTNFKWRTDFNISSNRNKVSKLGNVDFIPVSLAGGWITNVGRVIAGEQLGTAYGYVFDGVYQIDDFTWQENSNPAIPHANRTYVLKENVVSVQGLNVKPGSFKFKDLDGDNVITVDGDRKIISRSAPKLFGGLSNQFSYKAFDFSFFFEYFLGNQVFNEPLYRLSGAFPGTWMNISRKLWYNRWTPENPTNEYGTTGNLNVTANLASSYYVEDASWIRLKTVSLGYQLKNNWLANRGAQARFYLTGSNLFTFTKYSGFDPEINSGNPMLPGFERVSYPRAKSVLLGVTASF